MADSLLGRIDPRWKIILALTISMAASVSGQIRTAAFMVAYGLILVALGKFKAIDVAKRLAAVNGLLLSLWLTLPFTTPGNTLAWGPLSPSVQGLELAAVITLKSTAMTLVLLGLLGTSPLHLILQGLRDLGLPSKLVMLLHFCSRYVHVIADEKRRIHEAATLRGYRPGLSKMGLKTAASLVGSLLVKSYDRSMRVNDALTLRGFDGSFPTVHQARPMGLPDIARFGGLVAIFGGCLVL